MLAHQMLMGTPLPKPLPSPIGGTASLEDRLRFWQAVHTSYARLPLAQREAAVEKLQSRVRGVEVVARIYRAEHDAARFGSARLYSHVLDIVVGEVAALIRHDQPHATDADIDRVTADLVGVVENAVLTSGRLAVAAESLHYGAFRHIVGVGATPSLRWLWGTVLALLWTIGDSGAPDEFTAATRSIHQWVGDREFRLFGAVMLSLHILFGILPAAMHESLARYLAL